MSPAVLGFVRGIGSIILMAIITYLADSVHLNGVVSASLATFISGIALAIEHSKENSTGKALFGAVQTR